MRICPTCKQPNAIERTICEVCETSLENIPVYTSNLQGKTGILNPNNFRHNPALSVTNVMPEKGYLRLEIFGEVEPLIVPLKKELILGRRDPGMPLQPDIDLAPYAGYRMGVSRRHAKFTLSPEGRLMLADLGSSNGTFLNDNRLGFHQSYRVNDADLIALGQMVIQVFYAEERTPAV